LSPGSAGGAYSTPADSLAAFDSPTSKRGGRGWEERGGEMLHTPYGKFLVTPLHLILRIMQF